MLTMKDILREGNKKLKLKSKKISIPVCSENKKILLDLLNFVIASQDEELCEKLGLRPAVGLAAPQIGILKRMFAIVSYDLNGDLFVLPLVNPEIISHSDEITYLPGGEGCLSVDRITEGLTPRYKTVTFRATKYDYQKGVFEEIEMTATDYISIVFQHELDHLNGILFVDNLLKKIENATPLTISETKEEDSF